MNPISKEDRLVANIHSDAFTVLPDSLGNDIGQSILQLNTGYAPGVGFHAYKMAPGMTTETHVHTSHEEFFVLEGDLTDNDGTEYVAGDLVLLKAGTAHNSTTRNGCTLLVYIPTAEDPVAI